MFERFFGRRGPKPNVGEPEAPAKFEGFNLEPGKAYILLGGEPKEVKTNCGGCGAPYKGPCQPACEYCLTHRLAYYVDISDVKAVNLIPDEAKGKDMAFVLPEGGSSVLQDHSQMDLIISEKVKIGFDFEGGTIIAKDFSCEDYATIGTLVITDGGNADIGYSCDIGKMIVGKNARFQTENYTSIDMLLSASHDIKYELGYQSEIGKYRPISREEFVNQITKAAKPVD